MPKLLITGAWSPDEQAIKEITALGFETVFMPDERASVPCKESEIEAVICNGLFLYHNIENFSNLRHIQLTSAGYDRVPLDYIKAHNIRLYNAGNTYAVPMAEYTVFAVMHFYKRASFFYANKSEAKWEKNRNIKELFGKTVCIVGCGNVGMETAKRFKAFGCNVIGVNRTEKQLDCFDRIYPIQELDTVLPMADIVVLSIASVNETKHLINANRLALLRDGCVLVNLSRGDVVDTNALVSALENRSVCAALDVFEEEPLPVSNPLWALENVLITPHNSFIGDGVRARLFKAIYNNLKGFIKC